MCEPDQALQLEPKDPGRRGFFAALGAVVVALVTFPARRAAAKKVAVELAKTEALQKVGGSALIKIKEQKVLLVRDTDKSVRAFDPMCSHKKCTVKFTSSDMLLHCPCHKSAYDLDGKKLDGPAPRGLNVFPASLEAERVVVTLPDEE